VRFIGWLRYRGFQVGIGKVFFAVFCVTIGEDDERLVDDAKVNDPGATTRPMAFGAEAHFSQPVSSLDHCTGLRILSEVNFESKKLILGKNPVSGFQEARGVPENELHSKK
jgi:hypothetical protein